MRAIPLRGKLFHSEFEVVMSFFIWNSMRYMALESIRILWDGIYKQTKINSNLNGTIDISLFILIICFTHRAPLPASLSLSHTYSPSIPYFSHEFKTLLPRGINFSYATIWMNLLVLFPIHVFLIRFTNLHSFQEWEVHSTNQSFWLYKIGLDCAYFVRTGQHSSQNSSDYANELHRLICIYVGLIKQCTHTI